MSAPKNKILEQKPIPPKLEKKPYEPPQAVFVSLKMEDLLEVCDKPGASFDELLPGRIDPS